MSSRYVDELLVSLKGLFKTSAYSDLIIECGDDENKVHRAVERGGHEILVLVEDDPQAVRLMLHYLYHLDYPEVQGRGEKGANGQEASQANPPADFSPLEKKEPGALINGRVHNGNPTASGQPQRPMEYSIENEQFADPPTSPSPTGDNGADAASRKSKKKKRRNTQAESDSSSAAVAVQTPIRAPIQAPAQTQEPSPAVAAAQAPNLAVHARLYALASKYAVEGLRALAAEKFERGIGQHWETEDFLRAAREAYTSTDRADRRLRDAVLAAVKAHPQLLERARFQEVIRGLELSFDPLMHIRGGPNGAVPVGGAA
ncbi:hypothetical protein DL766_008139 [Monosporascus sp. MC13-8B]|uniref:BTB domain-containing protein n=1 Tax=Monosporascus cannonballus TaxID=155416 RepID=A0ABY0H7V7_9PEZI|nr:hypothetical protein DL763_007514 [Monosporascus cannonballus]RYO84768.1 hypothetical protein DL762_005490 [Monosporascus cannonballus]RYP20659.1 hypothetical protein DL766_008139 [Monosporascus sp. MC13-8B]